MASPQPLPDATVLRRLLLGQLPPAEAERLCRLLEQNPAFAEAARLAAEDDTLVVALRAGPADDFPSPDARLEALMRRLSGLASLNTPAAGEAATVHEPATRVGGRPAAADDRLAVLLERWNEQAQRGAEPRPEEVCREWPELVPAFRERLRLLGKKGADPVGPGESGGVAADRAGLSPPVGPGELGRLGHYRVLKVLGAGGMGTVFLAEDVNLQRHVALKTMKPEIAAARNSRDRFKREARATAQIEHDHIVPIYQVGEENGVPFLAMPLLRGRSLEERLRDRELPPLTIPQVVRVGREVALGLAAAHARGLVHRDIKPANIWLEQRDEPGDSGAIGSPGRVKILDFGLARGVSGDDVHLTASGAIVGTPAYMAPEQARGLAVDHRCDLFSLGVILYQMTTGRRPFTGPDAMAILMSLAVDHPPPARQLNPAVPPALSDLIARLLAKDPAHRPGSAREAAQALAAIERGGSQTLPVPAARPLPVADANPWADIDVTDPVPIAADSEPPEALPVDESESTGSPGRTSGAGRRKVSGTRLVAAAAVLSVLVAALFLAFGRARKPGDPGSMPVGPGGSEQARDRPTAKDNRPGMPPPAVAPFDGAQARQGQEAWSAYLGEPVDKPGPLGMAFRLIPPGVFTMGTPESVLRSLDLSELPQDMWPAMRVDTPAHRVRIARPFYLAAHETTVAQFRAFVEATRYQTVAESTGQGVWLQGPNGDWRRDPAASWRKPGFEQADNHPVVGVTDEDGKAFCRWLGERDGRRYRLPTEAEWEYACRAGTATLFSTGDALTRRQANVGNAVGRTVPVGSYSPNPFGLFDMHGNAWERVSDWYDAAYYRVSPPDDPPGPPKSEGPDVNLRVGRGGGWYHAAAAARSGVRGYCNRSVNDNGFRVLLEVDRSLPVAPGPRAVAPADGSDRSVAEWVRSVGGTGELVVDGQLRPLEPGSPLPERVDRLKSVRFGPECAARVDDESVQRLAGATGISELSVVDCPVTESGLGKLFRTPSCAGMTRLTVTRVKWTGADWTSGLKGLVDLELRLSSVGDDALRGLPALPALAGVCLEKTEVTDAGVRHLADCAGLVALDLSGTSVGDGGLAHLARVRRLTRLSLTGSKVTDAGLGALAELPLQELGLDAVPGVTAKGLDGLRGLRTLRRLNVKGVQVDAGQAGSLADALPRCRIEWDGGLIAPPPYDADRKAAEAVVEAGGTAGVDSDQRYVTASKAVQLPPGQIALRHVDLASVTRPVDPVLAHLEGLPELGTVILSRTAVTDAGLARLRGCRRLEKLYLWRTGVTDQGLDALRDAAGLRLLHAAETKVGDAGLARLARLAALEELTLDGCPVTDAGLAHLDGLSRLRRLFVHGTRVSEAGARALSAKLPRCKIVTDGGTLGPAPLPPPDAAWLRRVRSLPVRERLPEFAAELKRRNPGYDGSPTVLHSANGFIHIRLPGNRVPDLTPVQAYPEARGLDCASEGWAGDGKGKVADLRPLAGLKLEVLSLEGNRDLFDLEPLRGMPLTKLFLAGTGVEDLSPLAGMKLTDLSIWRTEVSVIAVLEGMPIQRLWMSPSRVADLSALRGMPLVELDVAHLRGDLSPLAGLPLEKLIADVGALRRHSDVIKALPKLSILNGKPAAEFWK